MINFFEHVTKFCDEYNIALEHIDNLSEKDEETLTYREFNFAKAITQDLCDDDARRVAKIILAYCGENKEEYSYRFR